MTGGCTLCPRRCGADREEHMGYCGAGKLPHVAKVMLHTWEEPCISGVNGTGAIFFCGCNLHCVFCQNHAINHTMAGERMDAAALAQTMLTLQSQGAHTIDLVTPTPHVDVLLPAIARARRAGLTIPIAYNTNAYETLETINRLNGFIDIYLPDFKYVTPATAQRYSGCGDYFAFAAPAIKAMHAQVGSLCVGSDGIAGRGMIVRHLVLPGAVSETRRVLEHMAATLPQTTHISLMGQYVPMDKAALYPPLDRKLLRREYARAVDYCLALGFTNVYIQSLDAADASFTPVFAAQ